MHATFLGCVLFCGKFGGRGMIGCFVVGKGNIVRFGLWLDFMFPFGLRFRNPFVSIPLVTFFSVGPASFSWGVFVDWFFCMPLYSFFHFFLMKVVFLIKNACNIPMEKKKEDCMKVHIIIGLIVTSFFLMKKIFIGQKW